MLLQVYKLVGLRIDQTSYCIDNDSNFPTVYVNAERPLLLFIYTYSYLTNVFDERLGGKIVKSISKKI